MPEGLSRPQPDAQAPAQTAIRRIAVTGASGFIGRRLVARLTERGDRVTTLRHRRDGEFGDAVQQVPGGLDDADALRALTDGADAVIHLGGLVAAPRAQDFERVNTAGTERLAAAAERAGVARLLYMSSLAAREPRLSAYAASKRAGEDRLAASRTLAWDALRPPAVYGPGDVQILTFLNMLKRRIALLPGGDDARVSLIHVDDLVDAILAWLDSGTPRAARYELSDGRDGGYAWRELMATAADEIGVAPVYVRPPRPALALAGGCSALWGRVAGTAPMLTPGKMRELTHADWTADPGAFVRATGWRPRIGLRAGLRGTIAWYRERGWL